MNRRHRISVRQLSPIRHINTIYWIRTRIDHAIETFKLKVWCSTKIATLHEKKNFKWTMKMRLDFNCSRHREPKLLRRDGQHSIFADPFFNSERQIFADYLQCMSLQNICLRFWFEKIFPKEILYLIKRQANLSWF